MEINSDTHNIKLSHKHDHHMHSPYYMEGMGWRPPIAPLQMSLELLHLSLSLLNSYLYPHSPLSSAILFTGMLAVNLANIYKLITFLCITLLWNMIFVHSCNNQLYIYNMFYTFINVQWRIHGMLRSSCCQRTLFNNFSFLVGAT
jgi:hypothetical protein